MQDQNSADVRAEQVFNFLDPEEGDEDQYGEFGLERIIVTTRALGYLGRGAQVLCTVEPYATHSCPQCGALLTPVRVGELDFQAEVESQLGGARLVANLIAEHFCDSPESAVSEENA